MRMSGYPASNPKGSLGLKSGGGEEWRQEVLHQARKRKKSYTRVLNKTLDLLRRVPFKITSFVL